MTVSSKLLDRVPDLASEHPETMVQQSETGELTTTSLVIADGVGIQHKNVLETVRKNQADFEEFGPIAFETRKGASLPQGGYGKSATIAVLNRDQALLLIALFDHTAKTSYYGGVLLQRLEPSTLHPRQAWSMHRTPEPFQTAPGFCLRMSYSFLPCSKQCPTKRCDRPFGNSNLSSRADLLFVVLVGCFQRFGAATSPVDGLEPVTGVRGTPTGFKPV